MALPILVRLELTFLRAAGRLFSLTKDRGARLELSKKCLQLAARLAAEDEDLQGQLFLYAASQGILYLPEGIKASDPQLQFEIGSRLLATAARNSFASFETRNRVFDAGEAVGVHMTPVQFYSPIPSRADIELASFDRRYDDLPRLGLDKAKHIQWLDRLAAFDSELADVPLERPDPLQFYWCNPAFSNGDAMAYYGMIREQKPSVIVEIGCGYSTLLALKALSNNGKGRLICIEPYPQDFIRGLAKAGKIELMESIVQKVDLKVFELLGENDILFIDSSHVSKCGSDVNHEVFTILPALKKGVVIHFHDIFFPWEFKREWLLERHHFWNEQYLLQAFLAYNDAFEILLANQFVGRSLADKASARFKSPPTDTSPGGGSLWIRKTLAP